MRRVNSWFEPLLRNVSIQGNAGRRMSQVFVTKGYDRIEGGHTPRRHDPEKQSHHGAEEKGRENREQVDRRIPVQELRERELAERPEENAEDPADQAEHQRLDQELKQDIESGRTESLAHA